MLDNELKKVQSFPMNLLNPIEVKEIEVKEKDVFFL
jgi:hypothetical protein